MATIRKHGNKWQVQVRRAGSPPVSRSFTLKADAEVWARQTEVQADKRAIPADARILDRTTVLQLMQRYQESVIPQKRCAKIEADMMAAMMKCSTVCHTRCDKGVTKAASGRAYMAVGRWPRQGKGNKRKIQSIRKSSFWPRFDN